MPDQPLRGEVIDDGVTATDRAQSRNACPYCAMTDHQRAWARFGEVMEWVGVYWTHCTTCHSRDHNACSECGACLPDYEGAWDSRRADHWKNYRIDTAYCSNACRQRAYRKRKRGRGGVTAARYR